MQGLTKLNPQHQERFEDLCQFIKVSERGMDNNQPVAMSEARAKQLEKERHVPTGMSYVDSRVDIDSEIDRDGDVYIPAAFKRTRTQKMREQGEILEKLQSLIDKCGKQEDTDHSKEGWYKTNKN